MLKLISILIFATGLAAHAQSDLGATLPQLEARYGKPAKIEPAWCGGTAYGFLSKDYYSYVYAIASNGVVGDVMYFNFKTPFTQESANALFHAQFGWVPPITWGDKEYKKGLGEEKGKHWVCVQWVVQSFDQLRRGKTFISNSKDKGWQFRTADQFIAEQAVIKRLKQAKGQVVVGTLIPAA